MIVSREEHERFLKILEKRGSDVTGNEWSLISADMGWSIDDVKLYAYWYMQQLYNKNKVNDGSTDNDIQDSMLPESSPEKEYESKNQFVHDDEWTFEETALFNTLLVTYDSTTPYRWEKIASLIPNKIEKQCREKWEIMRKKKS